MQPCKLTLREEAESFSRSAWVVTSVVDGSRATSEVRLLRLLLVLLLSSSSSMNLVARIAVILYGASSASGGDS